MANLTLFAQIISKLDRKGFTRLLRQKQTDKHQKGYDSWTHLVSMLFCQLAKSQSVRDISNGLRSATGNLNHLGVNRAPSKSNISYQNKHRDSELFRAYYFELLQHLGQQAAFKQVKFRIKARILLLDSTTTATNEVRPLCAPSLRTYPASAPPRSSTCCRTSARRRPSAQGRGGGAGRGGGQCEGGSGAGSASGLQW